MTLPGLLRALDPFASLRQAGVLGINRRNADLILAHNPRRNYPLVDDKLQTKELAAKAGIAVPALYGVVRTQRQVKELPAFLRRFEDFVIKPAHGSGGNGILVIDGHTKTKFRKSSGAMIDDDELRYHVNNIVSGMYSLGGHPDSAIIEYKIKFDPLFEAISYLGVPDIRIIVFIGFPAMSMVRLPTRLSDGKANLHQGAIGAGIHLSSGRTMTAVWQNEVVVEHPDTGHPIAGVEIPNWTALMELAAGCHELTGLGYIGVDIALDRDLGPLILEINARPGLSIQIANRAPLLPRIQRVEDVAAGISMPPAARARFAMENLDFGLDYGPRPAGRG